MLFAVILVVALLLTYYLAGQPSQKKRKPKR